MERKFLWVALGLAAVVVVAVAAAALLRGGQDASYNGSVINPPSAVEDFALTGPGGQTAHLSDFRGKVVLLYFGYTNCPDECPTTMAVLRKARADLGAQTDQVQVLLVTTDPARDTPERLASYLAAFDPTFIGLTGADADLQMVWARYGVTVMDEGTTHSTRVYVIDATGNLRLTLPYGLTPAQVVADLRRILPGGLTVRKTILVRVALSMALGALIAGLVSEVSFLLQDNLSRPPQEVLLVIPNGAAARTALGQHVLAPELMLVVGDTLVVKNEDVAAHTFGPLYIPPGTSASLALDHPENISVACSFQPARTFGLDVQEALTLDTRIAGILLAGVPMGLLLALYSLVLWPLKRPQPA